ncbi:MAG: hypothetical protein WB420_20175, partial [Bradyrhizobium sp.]
LHPQHYRSGQLRIVPHQEWAEKEDLFEIGMLAANPNFRHRGMCVAIYDEAGIAVSVMPRDTLQ